MWGYTHTPLLGARTRGGVGGALDLGDGQRVCTLEGVSNVAPTRDKGQGFSDQGEGRRASPSDVSLDA